MVPDWFSIAVTVYVVDTAVPEGMKLLTLKSFNSFTAFDNVVASYARTAFTAVRVMLVRKGIVNVVTEDPLSNWNASNCIFCPAVNVPVELLIPGAA